MTTRKSWKLTHQLRGKVVEIYHWWHFLFIEIIHHLETNGLVQPPTCHYIVKKGIHGELLGTIFLSPRVLQLVFCWQIVVFWKSTLRLTNIASWKWMVGRWHLQNWEFPILRRYVSFRECNFPIWRESCFCHWLCLFWGCRSCIR